MTTNTNESSHTATPAQPQPTQPTNTDLNAFMNSSERSGDTKASGRAIMIIIAIIVLVFINVGIFYTTRITKQTGQTAPLDTKHTSTSTLDNATIQKLQNRSAIDVENQLTPYTTGRSDPFVTP